MHDDIDALIAEAEKWLASYDAIPYYDYREFEEAGLDTQAIALLPRLLAALKAARADALRSILPAFSAVAADHALGGVLSLPTLDLLIELGQRLEAEGIETGEHWNAAMRERWPLVQRLDEARAEGRQEGLREAKDHTNGEEKL